MQTKTHYPSTFTFITLALSVLLLLAVGFALALGSLISLFGQMNDAAEQMIMAFAFGFLCLLLMLCAWFVLEKMRNKESADAPFELPFSGWQIFAAFGMTIISIGVGAMITLLDHQVLSWVFLPTLTIFVIVPPVWLIFALGAHGLALGARWRFFSIFGIGLTAAPLIIIILEFIVLFFGALGAAIYVGVTQPEAFAELKFVAEQLANLTNEEAMLELLAPYLTNPMILAVGIGYIAVVVPLIEELIKPLGVWLFAKQIESPAQGFALGLLSGAAFALFESLNASADASVSWGAIATARAGTSLLHITLSGIMGWGIVSAFKEKQYGRFFGAYFAAFLIHGMWNGAAAGTGISAIGEALGKPEWLFTFAPALLCGLLILGIGMFVVLIAANRKLKHTPPPAESA